MLEIRLIPEDLKAAELEPEEQATIGVLEIKVNNIPLTAGLDCSDPENPVRRQGPYVPGYYVAEWLTANYWRLRYEPKPENPGPDWHMSHSMSSIGEGYVWPKIDIWTDSGQNATRIEAYPSPENSTSLFRYAASENKAVSPRELERATSLFVLNILEALEEHKIRNSNLHKLYRDLTREKKDPELKRIRIREAFAGHDPGEEQ